MASSIIKFHPDLSNGNMHEETKNGFSKQSIKMLLVQEKKYINSVGNVWLYNYNIYIKTKLNILCDFFELLINNNTDNYDSVNINMNSDDYNNDMIIFNQNENDFVITANQHRYTRALLMQSKLNYMHNLYPPHIFEDKIVIASQLLSEFVKQENEYIADIKKRWKENLFTYFKDKKEMMLKLVLLQRSKGILNKHFTEYYLNIFTKQENDFMDYLKVSWSSAYTDYMNIKTKLHNTITDSIIEPNTKPIIKNPIMTPIENPVNEPIENPISDIKNIEDPVPLLKYLTDNPIANVVQFINNFHILESKCTELTPKYIHDKMSYVDKYNEELIKLEMLKAEIKLAELKLELERLKSK